MLIEPLPVLNYNGGHHRMGRSAQKLKHSPGVVRVGWFAEDCWRIGTFRDHDGIAADDNELFKVSGVRVTRERIQLCGSYGDCQLRGREILRVIFLSAAHSHL